MKKNKKTIFIGLTIVIFLLGFLYYYQIYLNPRLLSGQEQFQEDSNYFSDCDHCVEPPSGNYGQDLRNKYFLKKETKEQLVDTLKEKDIDLNGIETLTICRNAEIPPFYKDLMDVIEQSFEVEISYLNTELGVFHVLEENICDISLGWTKTEKREKYVLFTKPIYLGESIAVSKEVGEDFLNDLNRIIREVEAIRSEND